MQTTLRFVCTAQLQRYDRYVSYGTAGVTRRTWKRAKRRRIRTVMQELMYLAARLIRTGRRLKLAFGRSCRVVPIFRRLYLQLV